ncbi:hypothetical protein OE903_12625 [Bacillus sp. B6(2022)]|nr:hypothetical protein [Bacillus sp. B6(2022)]
MKDIKVENGVNSSVIQYAIDYNGIAKDDEVLIDRMRDNLGNKYRLETGTRFEEKQLSNKKLG